MSRNFQVHFSQLCEKWSWGDISFSYSSALNPYGLVLFDNGRKNLWNFFLPITKLWLLYPVTDSHPMTDDDVQVQFIARYLSEMTSGSWRYVQSTAMAPFPGVGFSPPGMISVFLSFYLVPCVFFDQDKTNARVVGELLTVRSRKK